MVNEENTGAVLSLIRLKLKLKGVFSMTSCCKVNLLVVLRCMLALSVTGFVIQELLGEVRYALKNAL